MFLASDLGIFHFMVKEFTFQPLLYQNDSSRIFRTLIIHESFICLTHMQPKWLRVQEENKASVSLSCKGSVLNVWD